MIYSYVEVPRNWAPPVMIDVALINALPESAPASRSVTEGDKVSAKKARTQIGRRPKKIGD